MHKDRMTEIANALEVVRAGLKEVQAALTDLSKAQSTNDLMMSDLLHALESSHDINKQRRLTTRIRVAREERREIKDALEFALRLREAASDPAFNRMLQSVTTKATNWVTFITHERHYTPRVLTEEEYENL